MYIYTLRQTQAAYMYTMSRLKRLSYAEKLWHHWAHCHILLLNKWCTIMSSTKWPAQQWWMELCSNVTLNVTCKSMLSHVLTYHSNSQEVAQVHSVCNLTAGMCVCVCVCVCVHLEIHIDILYYMNIHTNCVLAHIHVRIWYTWTVQLYKQFNEIPKEHANSVCK